MPLYDCGAPDCEECQRAFGPDRSKAITVYEHRERHYAAIEKARKAHAPWPCRVCLEPVAIYDQNNPFTAICPTCCEAGAEHADGEKGHVWEYERAERDNVCQKCGVTEHDDVGYISDYARI